MRTSLGLPISVDNVRLLLTNNLKVPLPDLGGDRLTDGTQHSEVLHLMLDVCITRTLEQAESSWGDVKLRDVVARDNLPVSGKVWVCWCSFEHDSRDTEHKRSVDDIGVTSDPTDVTAAEENVLVVNVKNVLSGHGSTEEVATSGVHDTLGLSSGTGCVEQEQRVLGAHALWGDVAGVFVHLFVPPEISSLCERHLCASTLENQAVSDVGALLKGLVDDALCSNDLASTLALIGCDDDLGVGINDTIAQRVGGEAGKNDRVDRTNTGASQESNERLGNHRHVQSYRVSLLDAHLLESVGKLADLPEELAVCDCPSLACLVALVDDGWLVWVLESMSVDAVVRGVQATLEEPGIITAGQTAAMDCLKVAVPA